MFLVNGYDTLHPPPLLHSPNRVGRVSFDFIEVSTMHENTTFVGNICRAQKKTTADKDGKKIRWTFPLELLGNSYGASQAFIRLIRHFKWTSCIETLESSNLVHVPKRNSSDYTSKVFFLFMFRNYCNSRMNCSVLSSPFSLLYFPFVSIPNRYCLIATLMAMG